MYALSQNGQVYSELNLKPRNFVLRGRTIKTERRPWGPLLQQKMCEHKNKVELHQGLWNSYTLPMNFEE